MSGMHALAEIEMFSPSFPIITHEERRKIAQFKIPCEHTARTDRRFYARLPTVSVTKWMEDWNEKLRQLEHAAGMPSRM